MTVPISGLVHIYGQDGVGKTTLALTTGSDPDKSVFIDDDSTKARSYVKQLGFKLYIDLLSETQGMNEVKFYQHTYDRIKAFPNGLDLLVFDNMKRVFNAAHSYMVANQNQYRQVLTGDAAMKNGQLWREARETLLPKLYALMLSKAELVIVITHEQEQKIKGVATGATEAAADQSLRKAASPIIRLTRDREGNPTPVGLVIKNLGRIHNRKIVNVLPPRVPRCDWDTILHYLENPVGDRALEPNETPDEFELSLITGSLTREQQRQFEFNKQMALMQIDKPLTDAIDDLIQNGTTSVLAITKALKENGFNVELAKVGSVLNAMRGGNE